MENVFNNLLRFSKFYFLVIPEHVVKQLKEKCLDLKELSWVELQESTAVKLFKKNKTKTDSAVCHQELLKHEHLPPGVDEGAAEVEAVHRLVHQPIKHHLPVP